MLHLLRCKIGPRRVRDMVPSAAERGRSTPGMRGHSSLAILSRLEEEADAEYCVPRHGPSKVDGIGNSLRSAGDACLTQTIIEGDVS